MENLIFLKDENEQEVIYYAIDAAKIETLNVSDTYDGTGQTVGSANAGDSLTLETQKAVDVANQFYHENYSEYDDLEVLVHYKIDDYISAYDSGSTYTQILESNLVEDVDYILQRENCEGFNYWNGNNWKSVIIDFEHGAYTNFSKITDQDLIAELTKALQNKEFKKEGSGFTHYTYGKYKIQTTQYASDFSNYTISLYC